MMKILLCLVLQIYVLVPCAYAGGAAMMKKQKSGGAQKAKMQAQMQAQMQQQAQPEIVPVAPGDVKDIVDIDQLMISLMKSAEAWSLIIQPRDKETVVEYFLNEYEQNGVHITKPARLYAKFVDQLAQGDPNMLKLPFDQVLRIVAIMEYDFDNGQDKDQLALKTLGQVGYEKNRQRLKARNSHR